MWLLASKALNSTPSTKNKQKTTTTKSWGSIMQPMEKLFVILFYFKDP
jgi:hypothetical protein